MATDWQAAVQFLGRDRVWCAYALADLGPYLRDLSDVWSSPGSLLLRFRGLTPPVLFAYGDPEQAVALMAALEPGRYAFTFDLPTFAELTGVLTIESQVEMHRMYLAGEPPQPAAQERASRLTPQDVPAIAELFGEHPDRPDAFHPAQMQAGSFFGVRDGERLVAVAGTHVLSSQMSVAAVGNVFTHPTRRGLGFGRTASLAVVRDLVSQGIETIVLNTQLTNEPAIRLYRGLGFESYCHYMEGFARLAT